MPVDNRTANYDWPKPHPTNDPRSVDVPRLAAAFDAMDDVLKDVSDLVDAGSVADEATARAGKDNVLRITPLRSRQQLTEDGYYPLSHFSTTGVIGSNKTNDSIALQAGVDAGERVQLPARQIDLEYRSTLVIEGSSPATVINGNPGVRMRGVPGKTVLRLASGQSTDGAPIKGNMITINGAPSGNRIEDIIFNLNGQNNPISPGRGSGVYNYWNNAAIFVSGSVASGGTDARLVDTKILNSTFINCAGMTVIALAQRYTHPGIKGKNVEVAGNKFYNNGLDVTDHSTIYALCDDVYIHHNYFDHPTASTGVRGPVVATELYGRGVLYAFNKIRNYCQMCWVSAGEEGIHDQNTIIGNMAAVNYCGINTLDTTPQDDSTSELLIAHNQIRITDAPLTHPLLSLDPRVGILGRVKDGNLINMIVASNILQCLDRTNNFGMLFSIASGRTMAGVDVAGNIVSGFSRGIWKASGTGAAGPAAFRVRGNTVDNCAATTTTNSSNTRGIRVGGDNLSYDVSSNYVGTGDTGVAPHTAIDLSGSATTLNVAGNYGDGTSAFLSDAVDVYGRRTGDQGLTRSALPTLGTYKAGDRVRRAVPTEQGTAGSKYVVVGWLRLTTGSAHVLGTDWLEERVLTGN